MFKEYDNYDALGLAELIRSKKVSAAEVLDAAIAKVDANNGSVNAVVNTMYDHARSALANVPRDAVFAGVPFMLKDLYSLCAGAVTTNGSRFFRDNLADHDTELVARYKRGGLVVMAKTNTPEFGLTITTEPVLFGPTRNPWNRELSAGGSSGGSAAAVAAGMVPAAHSSDGGGSIRIPASCCGVFGMKPTRGRNPQGPDRGEGWSGMSTEHVISRSVRDSAAMLDLTHGADVGAPYSALPPAQSFLQESATEPGRLRIAFATHTPAGEKIDVECEEAVVQTARLLESLGHYLEEAKLDYVPDALAPGFRTIIAGNVRASIDSHAMKTGATPSAELLEKITWMFFESGAQASAADYARAVLAVHQTGRLVGRFFERYDALLTPTLPKPPAKLGVFDMNTNDPDAYGRAIGLFTAFTAPFNASGNPAMSLPLHWSKDNVPIGLQIAGQYGAEGTLFRLAAQLERARPWADRRPVLRSSS